MTLAAEVWPAPSVKLPAAPFAFIAVLHVTAAAPVSFAVAVINEDAWIEPALTLMTNDPVGGVGTLVGSKLVADAALMNDWGRCTEPAVSCPENQRTLNVHAALTVPSADVCIAKTIAVIVAVVFRQ